ncbi:hypothetical protein Tco_1360336 [Tanacetum coccineum]
MATTIDFYNIELEYNFQECFNALTDKLDWNNPEGDHYPFDLSKPLPLQGHLCHLTIAADYFFNNDLEYLNSSDLERMYTTSIMKKKAARYDIVGIEDMVPTLWSTIKHGYDKDALKGIKPWGERLSKKLHGYGHLEEVVRKRAARQLYKFKEGNFVDLHLNNIEDMMILAVQHKLFHLNDSDIVKFIMALRIRSYDPARTGGIYPDRIEVLRNTKLLSGIEDSHHGPSDAMHNPSQPLKVSQKTLVSFLTSISIDFLTPR